MVLNSAGIHGVMKLSRLGSNTDFRKEIGLEIICIAW